MTSTIIWSNKSTKWRKMMLCSKSCGYQQTVIFYQQLQINHNQSGHQRVIYPLKTPASCPLLLSRHLRDQTSVASITLRCGPPPILMRCERKSSALSVSSQEWYRLWMGIQKQILTPIICSWYNQYLMVWFGPLSPMFQDSYLPLRQTLRPSLSEPTQI